MTVVVMAVVALCALPGHAGDEPDGITAIRTLYWDAGNAISRGEFRPVSVGFGFDSVDVTRLYGDPGTSMLVEAIKDESSSAFTVYTEYLYYPDGACSAPVRSVRRMERVSATELLITLTCDGAERAVTAVCAE